MTAWYETTTGNLLKRGVIEIGDGYRAKNSEFVTHGGLPFVRVADVSRTIHLDGLDELPIEEMSKYQPKVSRPFDSLVTMKGTVGRVAYVKAGIRPFVYSPQISYWRSHDPDQVNPRWLRYWLESPEFLAQASATKGATDMADYINLRDQRRMRITLPPQEVQVHVAEVVGSFDDLIENNRRRIEILEEMARLVYVEWFVHSRFPGHEDVELVDSDLGPIPEGWEAVPLSELVTTQYGYTESAQDEPVGPRYLRGMDMNKSSFIDWSAVPYCPISERDRQKFRVDVGDVFVIRMADPGKIGICEREVDAVFASYLVRLKPIDSRLLPYYLFFTLNDDRYQGWVTGASTGATRKSVSAKVMTEPPVMLPPQHVQTKFVDTVAPIRELLTNLLEQNRVLTEGRDLLLPRLISGELDVSDLDLDLEPVA